MTKTEKFLEAHNLQASEISIETVVSLFIEEMMNGLEGKESSLRMIPTYIEGENSFLRGVPVLAMDAGGTYFRAALVHINHAGKVETGEIRNFNMPGLEKEITAEEFFGTIADYIRTLASEAQRIGFCFSYPTEILPGGDGRLIQFCKEVQAPEVVGKLIGRTLLETLGTPDKKIVLLNDTVATLMAGKSASPGKVYDSFIGYILGTGTNTCYIEHNRNILKNRNLDQRKSQIINIESGNFGKAPRSDLDLLFDSKTINTGNYTFEKMFSGGYFGGLCLMVLKAAAAEGLFSLKSADLVHRVSDLSSNEANSYITGNGSSENKLNRCFTEKIEAEKSQLIISALIDRAAKLVAANLAAVILKTGKGKSPESPVLITVEGTVFYKLHNLRSLIEFYLNDYLTGDRKRYFEFTEQIHSSLMGAALAALIDCG